MTLSSMGRDWVTIEELDLFGTPITSPNGRFTIVTGSVLGGDRHPDGRRDGMYALLEGRNLLAHGALERPHDAKVANNGTFVLNDWMHSGEMVGRFVGHRVDGSQAFSHQFSANLACNGLSADGRYAACQTLSSPGSPDDSRVALFDVEAGELVARLRPGCGTANGFEFDTAQGRLHVLTNDGDRETYGLDGEMVDRQDWLDRRIGRGDLRVIGTLVTDNAHRADAALAARLMEGLAHTATSGDAWSRARAERLSGELHEDLGNGVEALDAYERALRLDPQVGVSRKADKLREQLAGPAAAPTRRMSRFERQAQRLGIRHELIALETGGPKQWRLGRDREFGPVEAAALDHYAAEDWSGAASEGGLILTLIKAASFARLAPRNADTFIEALYQQNVAFEEDRFEPAHMVETVRRADLAQIAANWKVISATAGTTPAYYPGVRWEHVEGLFGALGSERLAAIASSFATAPYDLRAGWPDLTLWRDREVRFAEIKSPTDQMHASQSRLITTVLVPLGFDVALVEVQRSAPA
ncbi:VRR-NUC domain-containing protein [Sphingomonas sp. PP-CE-1G-424]|uniref:VRR-NUC domain-containing protein n=1 Tax=Sphingomonas sp. PP-CE-1G-424 TaxID=2135658 RepID=UPI0014055B8A|nr:VRR-NUC domain-containing protein [Sphingomonas sp. PP-CE-1G-424]